MRVVFFAASLFLLSSLCPVFAQTDSITPYQYQGVRWRFVDQPSLITPLRARNTGFSAASPPTSYPSLSQTLTFAPQVKSARFADSSLTLSAVYFKDQELIPVSVDAVAYARFRSRQLQDEKFSQSVARSIQEAQQGKRRTGLSIGVDLPKRFDKIFGEGGGNLRVSGLQRVSFSGTSSYTDGLSTDGRKPSKFPSLGLEQISRFEITGTIGTKISVKVNQDNQTEVPLANRIQLRYKGDDDDILKIVEAGNTTLSLPNTRFVGYSSQIQGLFGIKAEAQLGNLKFSAIASQEKGSSERESVSPSGDQGAETIREYQYAEGRLFDLSYADSRYGDELVISKFDSIIFIEVYEHDIRDSANSFSARLFVNARDTSRSDLTSFARTVPVKLLRDDLYTLERDPTSKQYLLQFTSTRRDGLAVYMVVERKDGSGAVTRVDTVGSTNQTPFRLQYVRAVGSDYVNTHPTWNLMWRNVYNVPRTVRNPEDLQVKIFRGLTGQEGTSLALDYQEAADGSGGQDRYLRLMGLDQYSGSARGSDNKIDDRREIFRPDWGLLIFPSRRPFDTDTTYPGTSGPTPPIIDRVRELYERQIGQSVATDSKYYLQFATRTRATSIRLNRANIIEGSERVTVNGDLLTKGVDYSIIYDYGQVTLLSDRATDPNSDLRIEFEYAPFLTLAKKTLIGARAEYEWSRNLSFGSTFLFKSDKAQDRKPRVGQETAKATVADIDMKYAAKLPLMTAAVNALPLIKTEAVSTFQLAAEAAQSMPNPNVSGTAYIDDFESAVEEVSLGLTRFSWQKSSRPVQLLGNQFERSGLIWHSLPSIPFDSVFSGERPANQGSITPFRVIFRKNAVARTIVVDTVPNPDTLISITDSVRSSWAGMTRYFSRRVDEKRVQLFELRLKGSKGRIHFDFGRISEDIDGDEIEDSEDIDKNNVVDVVEDVGLDGVADIDELGYHPTLNPDPSGDNWANNYDGFNGTEGNALDALNRPDEEQLSTNGYERNNSYFSFFVDISDTTSDSSRFVNGSSYKGWKTFRIPIREPRAMSGLVGTPDWDQITHVRVWFDADSSDREADTLEIADWYFVQSNWQDSLLAGNDTLASPPGSFVVASISDEGDSSFVPPPGVEAYFDNTNNVTEAQRALLLSYDNFQPNDTGIAVRELIAVEGYSGYKNMELFVHGPDQSQSDSIRFFFRIGQDSVNFYEYRSILRPGWDPNNFVKFEFNELTGIKDSIIRAKDTVNARLNDSAGPYYILGQPNLNSIRYFAAGMINLGSQPVSGDIWLDELRVTDVRRDKGSAYRVDLNGQAADLFSYNFGYEYKDAYFRGISSATRGGSSENLGTGRTSTSYRGGTSWTLDKFLPRAWGASVPLSLSWNETREIPLQRTSTDIVIPEAQRRNEETFSRSLTVTASEKFAFKTKNPLIELLLNRPRIGLSYSRQYRRTPIRPQFTSENYNVTFNYNAGIKGIPRLPVFGWTAPIPILKRLSKSKLKLYPDVWEWSGSYARNYSRDSILNDQAAITFTRNFDGRTSVNHQFFPNLSSTVTLTTRRDLSDPSTVNLKAKGFKFGLETNYTQAITSTYDPKLLKFLTSSFSYGANYSEQYDRSFETRRGDIARNWNVSGIFDLNKLLGKPWKKPAGSAVRPQPAAKPDPAAGDRIIVPGDSTSIIDSSKQAGVTPVLKPPKVATRPIYDYPRRVLLILFGWIKPPTYKFGETYATSLPGLTNRPSLPYTIGFTDDLNVPLGQGSGSLTRTKTYNAEAGSGARFFGGLSVDVRYRRSVSQDLQRATQLTRTVNETFPELTISITRFSKLPLFQKQINQFIDVFSPKTNYVKSKRVTYVFKSGSNIRNRQLEEITTTQNPLAAFTFKILKSLSLNSSINRTVRLTRNFNSTNDQLLNETETVQEAMTLSTRYSFSSPGGILIPLFGRLKFKSTMSIDLSFRFAKNRTFVTAENGLRSKTVDNSELSIKPTIAYTFSQQIQGGLSFEWRDNSNALRPGTDNHTRALSIWTEIRF